eukprot:gene28344-32008_t
MKRFCHQNLNPRYNRIVRVALSSSPHFKNAGGALNLDRELILYGSKKQTPVSLKSLLETGKGDLLKGFEELPVRVAHRVEHLQSAPFLLNSPSIQLVCARYKNTFARLRSTPAPHTPENRELFTNLLVEIYDEHSA